MKNIIEQILDENNTSNLKIVGENGEIFTFEQVALIHLDFDTYAILHPIAGDVPADDVLVFKIQISKEDAELVLEEDETIIEECFDEYYKLLKNKKK